MNLDREGRERLAKATKTLRAFRDSFVAFVIQTPGYCQIHPDGL